MYIKLCIKSIFMLFVCALYIQLHLISWRLFYLYPCQNRNFDDQITFICIVDSLFYFHLLTYFLFNLFVLLVLWIIWTVHNFYCGNETFPLEWRFRCRVFYFYLKLFVFMDKHWFQILLIFQIEMFWKKILYISLFTVTNNF